MNPVAMYIRQINLIDGIIKNKTEGFSHADSMVQPPFPGNCLNWNVGHILVSRHITMGNVDGQTTPDAHEKKIYGWGSEPLTDSDVAVDLNTLLSRLDDASQEFEKIIKGLDDDGLARVINEERGTTVADRLNFMLMFHESYHAGQLELLHELALAQR